MQLEWPFKTTPHPLATVKLPPLTCTAIRVRALSPVFVSITGCVVLVVRTCCGAKVSESGERPSVAEDAPMPVSIAVCVPTELWMESVPFRTPDAVGVKTTATVHPVDGASVAPQVFAEMTKSPVIEGVCSVACTPPVFEMVMFWAGLLDEPRVTVPKAALAGSRTIMAGASPVPVREAVARSTTVLPGVLPETVRTPVLCPEAVGKKVTWTAQLAVPERVLPAQVSDSLKSPVIATLVTVSCPFPKFDICMVWDVDDCPMPVPEKLSEDGESCTPGGAVPIPVRETVCDRN